MKGVQEVVYCSSGGSKALNGPAQLRKCFGHLSRDSSLFSSWDLVLKSGEESGGGLIASCCQVPRLLPSPLLCRLCRGGSALAGQAVPISPSPLMGREQCWAAALCSQGESQQRPWGCLKDARPPKQRFALWGFGISSAQGRDLRGVVWPSCP